jgi:thiol-disulfide isomerase/thioredoxin
VPTRSRRKYVLAALALAAIAIAAIAVASGSNPNSVAGTVDVKNLPVGPAAPPLQGGNGWINSPGLTSADLKGKVVLYDFWTYSCVNCVRTLPHVEAWYARYAKDGLVVVGVHSPEFDFEKNHDNVRAAVKRLGVDYPVVLDDDMNIWNNFGNQYWPEKYVTDRQGRLRYQHIGEGNYGESEDVLRELLDVPKSAPRAKAVSEGRSGKPPLQSQDVTGETYLGLERGTAHAQPGLVTYPEPSGLQSGDARLVGPWDAEQQDVTSGAGGASIVLDYHAREVNLVMATAAAGGQPAGQPVDVTVEVDGKPLAPEYRTAETMVDAQGSTFVRVTNSDLYSLVLGPSIGDHTLRLTARGPGLQAFAFTFGA